MGDGVFLFYWRLNTDNYLLIFGDTMSDNNIPYIESDLYRIRHSAAHVMAEAVLVHFPEAKLAIGPPIEDGFYYDFDLGMNEDGKPIAFTPEDIEKIEATMKKLLKKNAKFEQSTMSCLLYTSPSPRDPE